MRPLTFSPQAVWRWGLGLLIGGLGLGLLLTLYLITVQPLAILVIPAGALGLTAAWLLFQRPLLNLCVVLLGFGLIIDFEAGIQVSEVLYGLYYLGFLAHWFVTRWMTGTRTLHLPEGRTLFLFLVFATLMVGPTLLFGGTLRGYMSEWSALIMLAIYFPVREACVRYPHGLRTVMGVLLLLFLLVTLRNVLDYQRTLAAATAAFQITRGRVATNDNLMMMASLFAFTFALVLPQWRHRLVLAGCFLLFFAGLILTQSRGFWVAFALGVFVLFVLIDRRHKVEMLVYGLLGGAGLLILSRILLGDAVILVLGGLLDRLLSLLNATSRDLSLINRFLESAGAWERIRLNPILGHGMDIWFSFYDITFHFTNVKTFIHNGYLSLIYRFGIWGLGMVLFIWGRATWRGVQVYRMQHIPLLPRMVGAAATAYLVALTLVANTSNPFYLSDTLFQFGLVVGLVAGAYQRAQLDAAPPLPAPVER